MQTADAIIVLGRGINPDGTLPIDAIFRVETAAKLFQEGKAPRLIMSGSWSFHLSETPLRTEAAAMAEHAVSLGVPMPSIMLEEESKDTLTNAYFVKHLFLIPNAWRNVVVVTSEDHSQRTGLDFRFVLGPEYEVETIASPLTLWGEELAKMEAKERRSLWGTKKMIRDIAPGDDAAIKELIYAYIPGFASREESNRRFAELMAEYDQAAG